MEVTFARCAGLDIHKDSVVACVLLSELGGTVHKEVRSFGTMTADLLALSDWLAQHQVVQVALESTGVYWKPLYNLLEGGFELLLVNAQHIKAVPGRKTDVKDSEWIADLLRHGLLRASFMPELPQRELRELTRYHTTLVRERAAEVNRLQKTLEGANLKLGSVASNVLGRSGREMLEALVGGQTEATVLAQLAKGKLRSKIPELERALAGRFGPHQRFLIAEQLAHLDYLDESIERVSQQVAERVSPFEEAIARLDTIPGVGRRTAEMLLAEMGTDMSRFPSAEHLASWAGMCPGNNESAGKRKSGKTRQGNHWLRQALVEAAQAASHAKDCYLATQYRHLAVRRGKKKAIVAVGHSILVIAYYLLRDGTEYRELGGNYYDERQRQAVKRRLVSRLEALGCKVTLEDAAPAA
jgi:transposase